MNDTDGSGHPAYIDLKGITDSLPNGATLKGLWVQTAGDVGFFSTDSWGYVVKGKEVRVSIRYGWPGYDRAVSGDGLCARNATTMLIDRLKSGKDW